MMLIKRVWNKLLYLLITGSTSVFIAACYGMQWEHRPLGNWTIIIKDNENRPIKGLEVKVLQYQGSYNYADTLSQNITDSSGVSSSPLLIMLPYNAKEPPTGIEHKAIIKDIDKTDNGGIYLDTLISKSDTSDTTTVIMRLKQ